ncbi:MAG: thioredoxin-like domain-containing protein [Verrucomicrobia bacterium]|nr:thioredoxin-like domain-containing protein [Verrucomicrobiota bacterium]MDA1086377.1 thioredoxin-like domain-containing protein [Verrucomicrobiota bacterium]
MSIILCSALLLGANAVSAAEQAKPDPQYPARTWTSRSGSTIEARLVKQEYGTVYLAKEDGGSLKIRLADLSGEDRAYLREAKNNKARTPAARAAENDSIFAKLLEKHLVSVQGKKVKSYEMATNPDYYAFYFSASWCGPCRRFTPQLVDFYNKQKDLAKFCEVILVSADQNKQAMAQYMADAKMPWPALSHDKAGSREVVQYAGSGIPCLVLVDKEGKVVSDSYINGQYVGPGRVMHDLKTLLADQGKDS